MSTQTRIRVLLGAVAALLVAVLLWISPLGDLRSYRETTEGTAGLIDIDAATAAASTGRHLRPRDGCADGSRSCRHMTRGEVGVQSDADPQTRAARGVIWTPGGVVGRTASGAQQFLDDLFERTVKAAESERSVAAMCNGASSTATPATPLRVGKSKSAAATTRSALSKFMSALVPDGLVQEDDCRLHLAAHHRAMCLAAAMLDDSDCGDDDEGEVSDTAMEQGALYHNNSTSRTMTRGKRNKRAKRAFVPLSDRCVYRHSLCAQFTTCVLWTRGRFTQLLTPSALAEVYGRQVRRRAFRTRGAFCAAQKQFLHGEVGATNCSEFPAPPTELRSAGAPLMPNSRHTPHPATAESTNATANVNTARSTYDNQRSSSTAPVLGVAVNRMEYGWLKRRLYATESHVSKNYNIRAAFLSRLSSRAGNRNRTTLLPGSLEPSPMRDLFQGKVVATRLLPLTTARTTTAAAEESAPTTSAVETVLAFPGERPLATNEKFQHVRSGSDDDSGPVPMEYFSPIETVALLWKKCQMPAHQGSQLKTDHEVRSQRSPCVILFNGDSLTREVFNRLVLHIRYGSGSLMPRDDGGAPQRHSQQRGPVPQGLERHWALPPTAFLPTHVEVGNTFDIVYRLFPTHDELIYLYGEKSFDDANLATNHTTTAELSKWTITAYLDELQEAVAAEETRSHFATHKEEDSLPLFHIVFLWDHLSQAPRAGPYAGSTRLLSALSRGPHDGAKQKGGKSKRQARLRGTPAAKVSEGSPLSPPLVSSHSDVPTLLPTTSAALAARSSPFGRGFEFEQPLLMRYPNLSIPLQIIGMTFWQKVMHGNLLQTLTDMAVLPRRRRDHRELMEVDSDTESSASLGTKKGAAAHLPSAVERRRPLDRGGKPLCTVVPAPHRTRCIPPEDSYRGPMYVMTPFTHDPLHPDFRALLPELDFSTGVASSEASCPDISAPCLRLAAKKNLQRRFGEAGRRAQGRAVGVDNDKDIVDDDDDVDEWEKELPSRVRSNVSGPLGDEVLRHHRNEDATSALLADAAGGEPDDVPLVSDEQERQEMAADEADGDDEAVHSAAFSQNNGSGSSTRDGTSPLMRSHKCRLYNVPKTLEWFQYLELLLARRERLFWYPAAAVAEATRSDVQVPPLPPALPWLHSFVLFDKAKAQFSGLPVGDARHFSCHARTTRKYRRRDFLRSLQREAIEDVLAPIFLSDAAATRRYPVVADGPRDVGAHDVRVVPHSHRRTLCGRTLSVAALADWFERSMKGRARRLFRTQKFDAIPMIGLSGNVPDRSNLSSVNGKDLRHAHSPSIHRTSVFFSKTFPREALRSDESVGWTVSSSSPPKDYLAMRNNGVDRCQNSGDLFLVQMMLMDWFWKHTN